MNKITLAPLIVLLVLLQTVSATTVELSTDKDVVWIGQKIEATLKLHSEDKITGQLTVINLDEKRQEKILLQSVRAGCTCLGDTRIQGTFEDTSTFTPIKTGNYQVRAYFDQIEKTINFTVKSKLDVETTTTTTTAPPQQETGGYLQLDWYNLDTCKRTVLGSMNTLNIDIGEPIDGYWASEPNSYILYRCDGKDMHPVDKLLLKGGSNIGSNQTVAGSYRLMVRCGRNTLVDDLTTCSELEVYLDTGGIIVPEEAAEDTTTSTTTSTTSTTTLPVLTTSTALEDTPTALSESEKEENASLGQTPKQDTPLFDGCLCEWAPAFVAGMFIFIVLVGAVYTYIGGGNSCGKTRLEGEKK